MAPGKWTAAVAAVRPMLATLAELGEVPLTSDRLVYEPKYDGIRALVAIEPGVAAIAAVGAELARPGSRAPSPKPPALVSVSIWSRNGHDKTAQFPDLVLAFETVFAKRRAALLVDGEIVALDERGRPASFTRLQPRIHLTGAKAIAGTARAIPVVFVAFDLLRDGDEDLRRLPLSARRLRLQTVFRPSAKSPLRLSEMAVGDGRALLARAQREEWEGLIAKDAASIYETGRRSPAWRKIKLHKRQEFIVGGWTEGRQSRAHFGALLLGVSTGGRGGRMLTFVGSVGTGFDEAELERVAKLLKAREVKTSPFTESFKTKPRGAPRGGRGRRPSTSSGRSEPVEGRKRRAWRGAGAFARLRRPWTKLEERSLGDPAMTSLEPRHWVKPELVAEVKFAEWTPERRLRHPVYLGLRTDKKATEVRIEGARDQERGTRALIARLRALEDARKDGWLDLADGHRLHVTNLWKIFWPELRITKGDLLRYYVEVSPFILPAVADRPLVMKRFPNGIHGKAFYQQRAIVRPPAGVRIGTLPEGVDPIKDEKEVRNPQRFVGGSLTTLLYMAQMAAISQDPWFSTVRAPLDADQVAIDLDPGQGATWQTVLDVARWVRDEMGRLRVPAVPKTSGSRGLHIYVPLPPGTSYDTGQLLCQIVATLVATTHAKQATIERMVAKRPQGAVYVDYLQNILGKTLATAYSARASDHAGVSTPLTWKEVDEGIDAREFTLRTAPARFREVGDLWARLRTGKPVDLRAVLKRFARLNRPSAVLARFARDA